MSTLSSADFWSTAADVLAAGKPVFLAIVAAHSDHSPGTTGAKMLVYREANRTRLIGTIGGGVMELKSIEMGESAIDTGDFATDLETLFHRANGPGKKSGMICAGNQTNLYYLCRPEIDFEVVATIAKLAKSGSGALMQVTADGLTVAEGVINSEMPPMRLHRPEANWMYQEQLLNFKRITIIGGGHCSMALSQVMQQLGYHVTVIEDRLPAAADSGWTVDNHHGLADYRDIAEHIEYPQITLAVVMTTRADTDVAAIISLFPLKLPFLGIMGSAAKIAHIKRKVDATLLVDWTDERIHAPVGLTIGSHTPEEIAISIAAQILAVREATQSHSAPLAEFTSS